MVNVKAISTPTLSGAAMEALDALYPERLAEQIERVAHHAFRGEVWEKAVTYLRQAGASAMTLAAELEMRPLMAYCHLGIGRFYRRTEDSEGIFWTKEAGRFRRPCVLCGRRTRVRQ